MKETAWQQHGIDYESGLRQFVGNRDLYERYLAQYVTDRHCEDAFCALRRKELAEVQTQVHALKGLASTLGMTELFFCCSKVVARLRDEELRGDEFSLREEMRMLEEAHEDVLSGLLRMMDV